MKSVLVSLGLILALSFGGVSSRADPLKAERQVLWGSNLEEAVKAAERLGNATGEPALALLLETLKLGAPTGVCRAQGQCSPNLAEALIKAIAAHRNPKALEMLETYSAHRNAKLRSESIRGLGLLREETVAKRVLAATMKGLQDSDGQVRMAAAWVVSQRVREKLPMPSLATLEERLLLLLERGDSTAPITGLAAVGGYATARYLAIHIKTLPERTIASIYRDLLLRRDFGPDPVRQWAVKALGELKGEFATEALASYVANAPMQGLKSVAMATQLMER